MFTRSDSGVNGVLHSSGSKYMDTGTRVSLAGSKRRHHLAVANRVTLESLRNHTPRQIPLDLRSA